MFAYYDGSILAKYRVSIQLPQEIVSGYLLPFGEARMSAIAFEIAVFEAIITIRDVKSK